MSNKYNFRLYICNIATLCKVYKVLGCVNEVERIKDYLKDIFATPYFIKQLNKELETIPLGIWPDNNDLESTLEYCEEEKLPSSDYHEENNIKDRLNSKQTDIVSRLLQWKE